jgi:cysteinyl-tRNA synthetase
LTSADMATKRLLSLLALLGLVTLVSCGCGPGDPGTHGSAPDGAAVTTVTNTVTSGVAASDASRWAYMIQGDVTTGIAGTAFDALIMDYTKDGTEDPGQGYTDAEMGSIKQSGSPRLAIAYLSIGEAEDYRYYFDPRWTDESVGGEPDRDAPDWLGKTNPDWEGNYKVRYWSDEWQQIILGYLDKLVEYGFDGAYLDIVDGFEYWSDDQNGEGYFLSEAEAAERMIDFVTRIAAHARARDPAFLIVPQNGERILDYDAEGRYLEAIDGMGVEDLYFAERTAIDTATTQERVARLDRVLGAGKPVVVVDYVYEGSRDAVVDDFVKRAEAAGFSPYAAYTDRELDEIVTFAGQGGSTP